MPFDPQAQNQLCNSCNRELALHVESIYGPPHPSHDGVHRYPRETYSASPQPVMAPLAHPSTYYTNTPQGTMTPSRLQSGGHSISLQPMMAPSNLKRKYDTPPEEQYSSKRAVGNSHAPHTSSSLRQNVLPPTIDAKETIAITTETDDEGGDEFVDAPEDQDGEKAAADGLGEGGDAEAIGEEEISDDDESKAVAKHEADAEDNGNAAGGEEQPEEEEEGAVDDLFAQTFGKPTNNASIDYNDPGESDAEDEAGEKEFDRTAFLTGLQTGGTSTAKPTTTTSKPKKPSPLQLGRIPALIPRHLALNLRKQHSFHQTALHYLPRLSLAEHRYCIGVLKLDVPPRGQQSEKNFTWMKGNRLTTVETIRNAYMVGAAEEDVVLLVGFEAPGVKVRCEELDYFHDRRVIFRAVREGHRDAEGRGLAGELVKEVIPLGQGGCPLGGGGGGGGEAGEGGGWGRGGYCA